MTDFLHQHRFHGRTFRAEHTCFAWCGAATAAFFMSCTFEVPETGTEGLTPILTMSDSDPSTADRSSSPSVTPANPVQPMSSAPAPGDCSVDAECSAGSFCQGSQCRAQRESGVSCSRDAECRDGLTCEAGFCSYCPSGEGRICQDGTDCVCGATCGDAGPDCGFGQTCARFGSRPAEGVCVDDAWLGVPCGGACGEGEVCNAAGQCESVSRPSAAVLTSRVAPTGQQGTAFTYEVTTELVVFDADGESSDEGAVTVTDTPDDPLDTTDFGIAWDDPAMNCTVSSVSATARTVSVPLVLDQSGSITDTDPSNLRIPAAKEFLRSLAPADESALVSFADNNFCSAFPVTVYGGGFTNDHASFLGVIDGLAGCQGGGTPLYDAARGALNLVITEGVNDAKALVLFTDGADTSSDATEQQVIDDARAGGVKIFTIGLSQGVNHQVLANVAQSTSGAYFFAADVGSAISAFRGMNQLLTGAYHRYTCKNGLTATVPAGKVPGTAQFYLGVDVNGERIQAPVFVSF